MVEIPIAADGVTVDTVTAIIQTLCVIIVTVIAIGGVSTWKAELRGKKKYDLAEEVLTLFYQAQHAIVQMRNPMAWGNEGKSREPVGLETSEQKQFRDRAHILNERYEDNKAVFSQLQALRFRCKALFGKDSDEPFKLLRDIMNDLWSAADALSEYYWPEQDRHNLEGEARKRFLEEKREQEAIFSRKSKNDPITPRVDEAILAIENICMPVLQGDK